MSLSLIQTSSIRCVCLIVCDPEPSTMMWSRHGLGCSTQKKVVIQIIMFITTAIVAMCLSISYVTKVKPLVVQGFLDWWPKILLHSRLSHIAVGSTATR